MNIKLRCVPPHTSDEWVLRGVIPARGLDFSNRLLPVQVEGALATQARPLSRDSNGNAVTAEVIALMPSAIRDAEYDVRVLDTPIEQPLFAVNPFWVKFWGTEGNIVLRVKDHVDRIHEGNITRDVVDDEYGLNAKWPRKGPVMLTSSYMTYLMEGERVDWKEPWLAIHTHATCIRDSNLFHLDLAPHRGWVQPEVFDTPGHGHFKSMELVVPLTGSAISGLPEPTMGAPYEEDGKTVIPLVAEDGKLHLWPSRAGRPFRLILHAPGDEADAAELSSRRGFAVANWHDFDYSFWPQRLPIGKVPVGRARSEIRKELSARIAALQSGTKFDIAKHGRMGPWHPEGVPYGGMTGGQGIDQTFGTLTVCTDQPHEALLLAHARERMVRSRHADALYRADGMPVTMEEYMADGGKVRGYFNCRFLRSYDDPWGFRNAPTDTGLKASYEKKLLSYEPIDAQHLVRVANYSMELAALDGDPISTRYCESLAEQSMMTFWEGMGGRLERLTDFAQTYPGKGCDVGREHAWAAQIVCFVDQLRSIKNTAEWIAMFRTMLVNTYSPESGTFQAKRSGKIVDWPDRPDIKGLYRGGQAIENGLIAWALGAIGESIGWEELSAIVASAPKAWFDYAWKGGGPDRRALYGPRKISKPSFIEPPTRDTSTDGTQICGPIALAAAHGLDPSIVEKLSRSITGGSNALASMENNPLNNLGGRSALLGWLQRRSHQPA